MAGDKHELKLNRKLQNHAFSSWRLGADNHAATTRSQIALPYPVFVPPDSGPQDFLHVRESLLHNHLARSGGNCFVALQEPEGFTIQHLCASARDDGVDIALERVVGPLPVSSQALGQEVSLSCSVAVIQGSSQEGASPLLLFSSGNGDIQVCELNIGQEGASISPAVHPFHASNSDQPRPFIVEAAYRTESGLIRSIVWLISPRPGSKHVACETYILTLSHSSTEAQPGSQSSHKLDVVETHLLHRCHLPPYAVVMDEKKDSVLLAVEPAGPEDEEQPPQQPGATGMVDDDEEEGDKEPRNLEEAAARLDKYASENAVAEDSKAVWDMNDEDGGDELEGGAEPSCELLHFTFEGDASKVPNRVWNMSFGAHKLLGAQAGSEGSYLLGVKDDVDCALVLLQLQEGQQEPVVHHEGFAPALAYVIEGKVQRRHVLLGGMEGMVAAAIVEGQKYCYLYKQVDRRAEFGEQQVIDMQLEDDEAILGAQLFNGPSGVQILLLLTKAKLIAFRL